MTDAPSSTVPSREPSAASPGRYLPVRKPDASGKYGTNPTPSSRQAGSRSRSASRASREYSFCTAAISAVAAASASASAVTFDTPIARTLPASTSSDIAPTVSAMGVASSGKWW